MSRNMIETNTILFGKLASLLPSDTIARFRLGHDVARYIATDTIEKDWLQNSDIEIIKCIHDKPILKITFQQKIIYVLPEKESDEPFMRGLIKSENQNAGIFTLIWSSENYFLKEQEIIGYDLAENVFGREGSYTFSDLKVYFKDCDIWEADSVVFENCNISAYRIYGGRLITEEGKLALSFSQATLLKIKTLLEDYPAKIIGGVVFRGLTAIHWQHAFLEFYRCIERLYSVPNAKLAKEFFGTTKLVEEIESFFDKKWLYREMEMLQKLLVDINDTTLLNNFCTIFNITVTPDMELCSVIAKKIYGIRNSIAHFRQSNSDFDGDVQDWDSLISLMCDMIILLYNMYIDAFT